MNLHMLCSMFGMDAGRIPTEEQITDLYKALREIPDQLNRLERKINALSNGDK